MVTSKFKKKHDYCIKKKRAVSLICSLMWALEII